MGRHAEQRADGDHARAADTGDENVVRAALDRGDGGLRQRFTLSSVFLPGRARLLRRAAFHRDEARAKALQARVILIARRLVDRAFAPQLGLHRQDRSAVGLHAAIAAALAYRLVDEHPLRGLGILTLLAPPALLRRAGLIVDQHRNTFYFAQLTLHGVQVLAIVHGDQCGQLRPIG